MVAPRRARPRATPGSAPPISVDLVEDAELTRTSAPKLVYQRHHFLSVGGADVEHVFDVRRLPLRLRAGKDTDHGQVFVVLLRVLLNEGQRPRQRGRSDVTGEEEHAFFFQQAQRVHDARERLVAVIERCHRDGPAMDAAAVVDLVVVSLCAAVQFRTQSSGRPGESGAHPDLDCPRGDREPGSAGLR